VSIPDEKPETGGQRQVPALEGMTNRSEARLYLSLSVVWMIVIFAFSHQAYSGRITEEYLGAANIPIRKFGHISEFAILSLLYLRTLTCYFSRFPGSILPSREMLRLAIFALAMAFAYACSDEWHQAFVPGRSAKFADVLVDTVGMFLALGLAFLANWLRWKKGLSGQSQ
jgi:VanZ family protein